MWEHTRCQHNAKVAAWTLYRAAHFRLSSSTRQFKAGRKDKKTLPGALSHFLQYKVKFSPKEADTAVKMLFQNYIAGKGALLRGFPFTITHTGKGGKLETIVVA